MDRANEPSEMHTRHDVLHAFERLIGAWPVIQKKEKPGAHLDPEKKKRDAAEEIPVGELVNGNRFVAQRFRQFRPVETLIDPSMDLREELHLNPPACG